MDKWDTLEKMREYLGDQKYNELVRTAGGEDAFWNQLQTMSQTASTSSQTSQSSDNPCLTVGALLILLLFFGYWAYLGAKAGFEGGGLIGALGGIFLGISWVWFVYFQAWKQAIVSLVIGLGLVGIGALLVG